MLGKIWSGYWNFVIYLFIYLILKYFNVDRKTGIECNYVFYKESVHQGSILKYNSLH